MEINEPELLAAKEAIAAGRRDEARQLLLRYSRQHPEDYRPWLWLSGLVESPIQSLAYLERAETLQPGNPAVQTAREWAEHKLAAGQAEAPVAELPAREQKIRPPLPAGRPQRARPVSPSPRDTKPAVVPKAKNRSWLAPAVGFIFLAFLCGIVAALLSRGVFPIPVLAAGSDGQEQAAAPPVKVVADVSNAEATQNAILPVESPAPTATNTPLPTPTLQPTLTPSPTPSPVPTIVVFPGGGEIPQIVSVAENERWIDVDLTTQTLSAYEGATPVFNTLISSGMAGHETVTGQFRVWLRYEAQTMNGRLLGYDYYLENVPYVMYFYNDYALHGTFWHNNFGTPMSHGCVNLATPDAEWLFNWSTYGTLVNVHY